MGGGGSKVRQGEVVWVVGASSGIGEALAEAWHARGAHVVVSARRAAALDELVERLNSKGGAAQARALAFDATADDDAKPHVERALALFGRVDTIVLAHGISNRGSVVDTDISVERRLFDVNFFSYLALTKAILPHLLERGSGRVVVVSSVQGFFGLPQRAPYAASKHALHGYYESLRAEVKHRGLSVNILCPGYVRTELSRNALTSDATTTHGELDAATAAGFAPAYFAERALRGVLRDRELVVVAQRSAVLAIWLKRFIPSLLSRILAGRGKKVAAAQST